jgi:hypothetical protein
MVSRGSPHKLALRSFAVKRTATALGRLDRSALEAVALAAVDLLPTPHVCAIAEALHNRTNQEVAPPMLRDRPARILNLQLQSAARGVSGRRERPRGKEGGPMIATSWFTEGDCYDNR